MHREQRAQVEQRRSFDRDEDDEENPRDCGQLLVADQLRSGRKSATIRLGDKSGKYKKGMVVRVLCGVRFSPREHVFDAVIDKVEVKTLGELSPREIEHDNPEIRHTDEMANFLGQLYNREIGPDDLITVIRFSQILSGPVVPSFEGDLF